MHLFRYGQAFTIVFLSSAILLTEYFRRTVIELQIKKQVKLSIIFPVFMLHWRYEISSFWLSMSEIYCFHWNMRLYSITMLNIFSTWLGPKSWFWYCNAVWSQHGTSKIYSNIWRISIVHIDGSSRQLQWWSTLATVQVGKIFWER